MSLLLKADRHAFQIYQERIAQLFSTEKLWDLSTFLCSENSENVLHPSKDISSPHYLSEESRIHTEGERYGKMHKNFHKGKCFGKEAQLPVTISWFCF